MKRAPPLHVPANRVATQRSREGSYRTRGWAANAELLQAATSKNARLVSCTGDAPVRVVIRVDWLTIWTTWVALTATQGSGGSRHGREEPQLIAWSVRPSQAVPTTPGPPAAATSSPAATPMAVAVPDSEVVSRTPAVPVTAVVPAGIVVPVTAGVVVPPPSPAGAGRPVRGHPSRPGIGEVAGRPTASRRASALTDARPADSSLVAWVATGSRGVAAVAASGLPGAAPTVARRASAPASDASRARSGVGRRVAWRGISSSPRRRADHTTGRSGGGMTRWGGGMTRTSGSALPGGGSPCSLVFPACSTHATAAAAPGPARAPARRDRRVLQRARGSCGSSSDPGGAPGRPARPR